MRVTPMPVAGAAVDGAELAEHVAIADLEPALLAAVLLVLRVLADRGELKDAVAAPMRVGPLMTTCGPTTLPAPTRPRRR